jgi:polyhydroxybutyrate depolymerase
MLSHRAVVLVLVLAACGGEGEEPGPRPQTFGGDRPSDLKAPPTLTEGKLYPLVLVLHGFGANGFAESAYLGTSNLPAAGDAFVIAPDGTTDSMGRQFWNADPACCDFDGKNPDDVAYLGGLIDDVVDSWPIDPDQVFVLGHSNGGFMAYRLACERADVIAAIGSLAGLASTDPAMCQPARPVNVLQIHGTADAVVPYAGGGTFGNVGAVSSVTQWATHNACGTTRADGAVVDLDTSVVGSETHPHTTTGCPANGAVDLWELQGSGHIPSWGPAFTPAVMQWFADHSRS